MHDDGACRTLAAGFFELVSPAAVIGHSAATEAAIIARIEVRIVDQDDDDFSAYIHAFVIVPAKFRRIDAVADEHEFCVGDIDVLLQAARPGGEAFAINVRTRAIGAGEGQRRRVEQRRCAQHSFLAPRTLAVWQCHTGLKACRGEHEFEIFNRQPLAIRARRTTFKFVRRQRARIGQKRLRRQWRARERAIAAWR